MNNDIKNTFNDLVFRMNNLSIINEEIYNNNEAVVYQGTKLELLKSLINSGGFSAEWFGANGGNMYTRGVYTNYEIGQTIRACKGNKYGTILVKFKVNGGFSNFLIFDKRMAIKQYGKDYSLYTQLKKYPKLVSLLGDNLAYQLSRNCEHEDYTSNSAYKMIVTLGGTDRATKIFASLGIRGLIFYGHNDGPVAIIHNCDEIDALSYVDVAKTELKRGYPIPWIPISFNKSNAESNEINHIQYFMAQFNDKYIYNKNTRSYDGEILVKNRETGLWTFIDVKTKKPLFNIEFYNADIFENGKARVKINKDDDWYYINKQGELFFNKNDEESFSDLDTFMSGNEEEMNDFDFDNLDFSDLLNKEDNEE